MTLRTNEFGQPIGDEVSTPLPSGRPDSSPMVGRSCSLTGFRPDEHAAALHLAFPEAFDEREWTYLGFGPFDSQADFDGWASTIAGSTDPLFFVIDDGHGPCGIASLLRINPDSGSVEVGHIHFAQRLARTAAATEAMFLMMQRVFDAGYRRYEWKCDALNAGSRSAASRLGFSFEGVFRQATTYKGRNRDTAWYSVIDTEWPARRAEFERWLDPENFDADGVQRTPLRHAVD
ncbi:MAG: GNAT family protein [Ilumatobacter sp.]